MVLRWKCVGFTLEAVWNQDTLPRVVAGTPVFQAASDGFGQTERWVVEVNGAGLAVVASPNGCFQLPLGVWPSFRTLPILEPSICGGSLPYTVLTSCYNGSPVLPSKG